MFLEMLGAENCEGGSRSTGNLTDADSQRPYDRVAG